MTESKRDAILAGLIVLFLMACVLAFMVGVAFAVGHAISYLGGWQ